MNSLETLQVIAGLLAICCSAAGGAAAAVYWGISRDIVHLSKWIKDVDKKATRANEQHARHLEIFHSK